MSKKPFLALAAAALMVLAATVQPAAAQTKTTVTWFVGLGTGTDSQQIAKEKALVDKFNASQSAINLVINISPTFATSLDAIRTLIASGNPPDIVGPVGVGGSNELADQWMDLKPLMDKNNYDLSEFDPALVKLYSTLNGGYSAIPFAVYPTVTLFNKALFDEAGLKYPPQKFGDKYTMPDGSQVDWNYDTALSIAKILTVDKNGNDATMANFDPKNIVQYGLDFQYAAQRLILDDLQPEQYYDATTNKISFTDNWKKAIQWDWDALWKYHVRPGSTASASALLQPSNFDSGHVAMTFVPIWYTCCMTDTAGKLKWDMAVVPNSFDGKPHVATDADTFRVIKSTKNPDATFTVLSYILKDAVPDLAPTYGAFPARASAQQGWIDSESKTYTQGVDWAVIKESLAYVNPANLHHESNTPHYSQLTDRWNSFQSLIEGDNGPSMNVSAEVDKLQADLQSIVNGTFPTATPVPPTNTPAPTAAATKSS